MSTDTRTPAEIEYDRIALSNRPIGAMPPLPEAGNARVEAVRFVCDDDIDPCHGKEIGTDYNCGKTFIHFPDDGDLPTLSVFEQIDYDLDLVARDLPDLVTLLNDPRVNAEMARYEAGQVEKHAA